MTLLSKTAGAAKTLIVVAGLCVTLDVTSSAITAATKASQESKLEGAAGTYRDHRPGPEMPEKS